jgi:hypothetical protein
MESRESTRLGQNVKLLTYVSIFYLPLAFCTASHSNTTPPIRTTTLTFKLVPLGCAEYP